MLNRTDGKIHVYSEKVDAPDHHLAIENDESKPDPFVSEMKHFLDCVQKNTPCICDGLSERESLAVVLGGFESMETGREVKCYGRR